MRPAEKKFEAKGRKIMSNLIINQADDKEFFTEKATIVAGVLKDGKAEEAKEVIRSIGYRLVPVVEQFIDCESISYKLVYCIIEI